MLKAAFPPNNRLAGSKEANPPLLAWPDADSLWVMTYFGRSLQTASADQLPQGFPAVGSECWAFS